MSQQGVHFETFYILSHETYHSKAFTLSKTMAVAIIIEIYRPISLAQSLRSLLQRVYFSKLRITSQHLTTQCESFIVAYKNVRVMYALCLSVCKLVQAQSNLNFLRYFVRLLVIVFLEGFCINANATQSRHVCSCSLLFDVVKR